MAMITEFDYTEDKPNTHQSQQVHICNKAYPF